MTLVWHIFVKDLTHLRIETGAVLAAALMSAVFRDTSVAGAVVVRDSDLWNSVFAVVALVLVVRLFQSEPVAGADHHWMTRPIAWTDLMIAKAVYVVLFIHIPFTIAQGVVLARAGFSIGPNIDTLLFSAVVSMVVLSLPSAAFALLTPGPGPFLIWGIVVGWLAATVAFDVRSPMPPDAAWLHETFLAATAAAAGLWALVGQYRNRNTARNRLAAAFIVAAGLSAAVYFPYSSILDHQYPNSNARIASSAFPVRIAPELSDGGVGGNALWFPMDAGLSAEGEFVRFDWIRMTLEGPDGRAFETEGIATQGFTPDDALVVVYGVRAGLSPSVEEAWRGADVTLRGRAYLSVFDAPEETEVFLDRESWTAIGDGVLCRGAAEPVEGQIECRRPWNPPAGRLTVSQPPHTLTSSPEMARRFSPYPGAVDASRIWSSADGWPSLRILAALGDPLEELRPFDPALPVTVIRQEPLGRVSRDFEFTVTLDDYRR